MSTRVPPTRKSIAPLLAAKAQLGQIVHLDLRGLDLVTAHRLLGLDVKEQVRWILSKRIAKWSPQELQQRIWQARECKAALLKKIRSLGRASPLHGALTEYLNCLAAWSTAIGFDSCSPIWSSDVVRQLRTISGEELALILQNDNIGCQTGVIRLSEDSVAFWHTEEDVDEQWGGRFDKLRLAWFKPPNTKWDGPMVAFIYPDLLPGPAFAWVGERYVQAVDAFFLKPEVCRGPMLANIASWVALFLGTAIDPVTIIEDMAPFGDGYAFLTVCRKEQDIFSQRIEFAGSWLNKTALGAESGSYIFQTNIISDQESPLAVIAEDLDQVGRRHFEQRIVRTRRAISQMMPTGPDIPKLLRLLASRTGGSMAYANVDVKAYLAGYLTSSGSEIWVGPGPCLLETPPVHVLTPR